MIENDPSGTTHAPHGATRNVTALFVTYGLDTLDLSWVPASVPVLVVHNDNCLAPPAVRGHPDVVHLHPGRNLGFGQGVMFGLPHVDTDRVVLCNPDVVLGDAHWSALQTPERLDIVTIPLIDADGRRTVVASPYPGPAATCLTGLHLGRLAPRGGRLRNLLQAVGGSWGTTHAASLTSPVGIWPLHERWVSGATMSVDAEILREVQFDERYFLYFEDTDLCARIATAQPASRAVVTDVLPAVHRVGGSVTTPASYALARLARCRSAAIYAGDRDGHPWHLAATVLRSAAWLLAHRGRRWKQATAVVRANGNVRW